MKKNNGITLVALVVTIVILLILASVSISALTGENGLITKAQDAKVKTEIANIKEQIQTDILAEQLENEGSNISDSKLKTILERYGIINYEADGTTIKSITTIKGNHEIIITDIWYGVSNDTEDKPTFTTVANKPDISSFDSENTYYVSWDLTSSPYAINETTKISGMPPSNWYNYTEGKNQWANIKTTGGGNDCYWVWISRYAYKIPSKNTQGTIEVQFLQDDTNIPIGETQAITNTTPAEGNWVVHPAFTNVGNGGFGELTGIWVAKFEASSSSVSQATLASDLEGYGGGDVTNLQVRVKPNVTSWRNITVSNISTVCENITTTGNSLAGTSKINSHMMKNTEWGAVAYLSRSKYGKGSAVWNNPYCNGTTYYSPITGLAGKQQDASVTTTTDTYQYDTAGGINASTSGNVYGIYDMVGGAWEYVAGYVNNSNVTSNGYNINLLNAVAKNSKYADVYELGLPDTQENNYNANTGKYGDAVYETSTSYSGSNSWDGDLSNFPSGSSPVFERGGRAMNSSGAGVFAFSYYSGAANTFRSFRPVLIHQY